MKTFHLSFPRLNISLTAPEAIINDIQDAFRHSMRPDENLLPRHKYLIEFTPTGFGLRKDGKPVLQAASFLELICRLEEDIENALIRSIGDWVGFHAGAVMIGNAACVIAGNSDTGKTTTTFNLIEMGHIFLCEEISPVDPVTFLVHPYPQVLGLDGDYAEKYRSLYRVTKGELKIPDSEMARYRPYAVGPEPIPLETILIPAYDPSGTRGIEKLTPGEVFTELLGYCFPPQFG